MEFFNIAYEIISFVLMSSVAVIQVFSHSVLLNVTVDAVSPRKLVSDLILTVNWTMKLINDQFLITQYATFHVRFLLQILLYN